MLRGSTHSGSASGVTTIAFGRGDAVEVGMSLTATADLLQGAIARQSLVELEDADTGEVLIVNPLAFKWLVAI